MNGQHRVTFLSGQLNLGGQERVLYLLLRGLDRTRFDPDVVSLETGGYWAGEITRLGIPVLELTRHHPLDVRRLYRLRRHLAARRPDLLYCLGFAANTYGRLAGRTAGVPHLVTGWRDIESSRMRWLLEVLLAGSTDRVICNSEAVRRVVLADYPIPEDRVAVVYNGVDIHPVPNELERLASRRALGLPERGLLVGSVSRLVADKNPGLFLKVAEIVRAERPEIHFALVGGGSLQPHIVRRAAALGLEGNLRLLGEQPNGGRLSSCFDVFLLTSDREGMPNAVLEAMQAGVPCVVTDVGGCPELVIEGKTGHLVPRGDAAGLARRVLELADNPELRRSFGASGRSRVLERFSIDRMVREHCDIFQQVIG